MFSFRNLLLFGIFTLPVMTSLAANEPHIGYLYPAGGQRGNAVHITAGGQFLRGASKVYISGEGVSAKVVKYYPPTDRLSKDQRDHIQNRLNEAKGAKWAKYPEKVRPPQFKTKDQKKQTPANAKQSTADKPKTATATKPPAGKADTQAKPATQPKKRTMRDHPLLYDLENEDLRTLEHITISMFGNRFKKQPNRQIAEMVLIEITIAPDAKPGDRELRIETAMGLTNPMVFQVGLVPEKGEIEPNDERAYSTLPRLKVLPEPKVHKLPVLFNGQIMPGDVDRFRFRAEQGQQLVIETQARSLIPYLADAVPGWFQATVAIYDSRGNEVAYADDYSFNPDPVLFYEIARSGEYELEIRDSIYRGREDFVYRIAVGETPFITKMFPLGGKEGVDTVASIDGWNLPVKQLQLDTQPGSQNIRKAGYYDGKIFSNSMPYAVDSLNECSESESNDTIRNAQKVSLPIIINGRIDKPGNTDVFRFSGSAGDEIVAEIFGRRLNSPLDSLLKLTDASGNVIQSNDDYVIKDSHLHKDIVGLVTHHADSYLRAILPAAGNYYVHLSDSQSHGTDAHAYRLRISEPKPDFALRVTPSSLTLKPGGVIPMRVDVLRKDGFNGAVKLRLKNAPAGFKIDGGLVPPGCDSVNITLNSPVLKRKLPVKLTLQGRANIGGNTVVHTAVAAENMMQAFLYRHLVPSKELMVDIRKNKGFLSHIEMVGSGPVKIPASGSTKVKFKAKGKRTVSKALVVELLQGPDGITLEKSTVAGGELTFVLKADDNAMEKGFNGNLIVEAFFEYTPKQKKGNGPVKKNRNPIGVLPAIPVQIAAGK